MRRLRPSPGAADHLLFAAAQAARPAGTFEPRSAGELSGLVVGVLADRQAEPRGDAIVADRIPGEPRHEVSYGFQNCYPDAAPEAEGVADLKPAGGLPQSRFAGPLRSVKTAEHAGIGR